MFTVMRPRPTSPDDRDQVRHVLGHFATGVTLVTSRHGAAVGGMTVNAFLSLSMDPPLVGVCLHRASHTHGLVERSGAYAISILRSDHVELARAFSRPHAEKVQLFAALPWETLESGSPVLREALAALDCRVMSAHAVADHTLFVASPMVVAVDDRSLPLVFFGREFRTLAPEPAAPGAATADADGVPLRKGPS